MAGSTDSAPPAFAHETDTESRKNARARSQEGVRRFLDRYAAALSNDDIEAIADCWTVPALVVSDAQTHAVASLAEVKAFFAGARDQYVTRGITATRPELLSVRWLTDAICDIDVRWTYLDDDGAAHGAERSNYILRRADDGAWRLQVAVICGLEA